MSRTLICKSLKSESVILEPGDATRYHFIISENPENNPKYLLVSSASSIPFVSYYYSREDIVNFFEECGSAPKEKGNYRGWSDSELVRSNWLPKYVMAHSGDCNYYTALAAMICAYHVIKEKRL